MVPLLVRLKISDKHPPSLYGSPPRDCKAVNRCCWFKDHSTPHSPNPPRISFENDIKSGEF